MCWHLDRSRVSHSQDTIDKLCVRWPKRNLPNCPGLAPHSSLFWTNTQEEHWPCFWLKILGLITHYAGLLVIMQMLYQSCALQEKSYPKKNIKGVPINPNRLSSAHLWNITHRYTSSEGRQRWNITHRYTSSKGRPSLPPFTKYICALNLNNNNIVI